MGAQSSSGPQPCPKAGSKGYQGHSPALQSQGLSHASVCQLWGHHTGGPVGLFSHFWSEASSN